MMTPSLYLCYNKDMNIETREKISATLKGNIPWNKGLKMSQEFGEHCRQGHLGLKLSEAHKKKISLSNKGLNAGSKNGMYGDKYIHSKLKICPICNKKILSRGLGTHLFVHFPTQEWDVAKTKISTSLIKYFLNIRGFPRENFYPIEFSKAKSTIIKRDIVCLDCGSNKGLCVHHLDWNKQNNEHSNLMLLCRSCHQSRHINGIKGKRRPKNGI